MHVNQKYCGFSLIELIIGIVVFSTVMGTVITLVVNQTQQSIDPILQSRASELAKSLASEISAKAYDENSFVNGSSLRCDDSEPGALDCTLEADFGPDTDEGLNRANFDDVDDYHNLAATSGEEIANALGQSISSGSVALYRGYSLSVIVTYSTLASIVGKQIEITVNTPSGGSLTFAFFRMNY